MTETEFRRKMVRRASRAIVGGFRPPDDPFTSWFGRVRVALPEETWPEYNGKPMMPLCQFNLTELPSAPDNMLKLEGASYRPPSLTDIALITVFIRMDDLPFDSDNGDQWLLRAYPTLEGLVVLEDPGNRGFIKPFPIRWEAIAEDYPRWDDVASMELPQELDDNYYDLFQTQQGTKIGGWPYNIQSEIFWAPLNRHPANPEYVFQIDSEDKAHWAWGDAGIGYFGRGTGDARDQWTLEWQCY